MTWGDLPENEKFQRLIPGRKRLMDTVRMISYRAESAMTGSLQSPTIDTPAARRLLQDLFVTEADILPSPDKGLLTVRVHSAARRAANQALSGLMQQLNEAEFFYPGTELKMVYELVGAAPPNRQNVSHELP